jgi:hypothetical protein
MPVDKFGHTDVGYSERIIAGGITLSQANALFLRADGTNAATENINLDSHKLVNVLDPTGPQDGATKNYVDTNSGVNKVSKTGDVMTGNLFLSIGSDRQRNMGCKDSRGNRPFALILGNLPNKIEGQLNQPITLQSIEGFLCKVGTENIIRFGKSSSDHKIDVYQDFVMNQKSITDLKDPANAQDASTRNYVDNALKKCYVGYIPNLEANQSVTGFVASASSVVHHNFQAYGAFNSLNADGSNGTWQCYNSASAPGWLQIKCPEPVKIWRFALKALRSTIDSWILSGSNDGSTFTQLLSSTEALLSSRPALSFFNLTTPPTSYQFYKLTVESSIQDRPIYLGVQVMQLYLYDT